MRYFYYDLYVYDVWGNPKDGFQVNDVYLNEKDIVISEDSLETDEKLIQALKRLNLIDKKIQFKSLQIEGESGHTLYFNDVRKKSGYCRPAFEMRCTKVIKSED